MNKKSILEEFTEEELPIVMKYRQLVGKRAGEATKKVLTKEQIQERGRKGGLAKRGYRKNKPREDSSLTSI